MAKVTALKIQARNKNRVNVYLDGEYAFGLVKIEAARLRIGQEVTDDAIARLKSVDESETAYEQALHYLSYRPRSESEIRRYLKKKDLAEGPVEAVVDRLKRAGLVDDRSFAGMWVENRSTFKPKARRALKAELRAKGVPAPEIEKAVAGVDEAGAARQLAAARAPRLWRQKLNKQEFRKKLGEYLARRGFDYETIGNAVEAAWRELGGDERNTSIESEI